MRFLILAVALTLGCTAPLLRHDSTPVERCFELVDTLCKKVEACGFNAHSACMVDLVPECAKVDILPLGASQQCADALRTMSCDETLPAECFAL